MGANPSFCRKNKVFLVNILLTKDRWIGSGTRTDQWPVRYGTIPYDIDIGTGLGELRKDYLPLPSQA